MSHRAKSLGRQRTSSDPDAISRSLGIVPARCVSKLEIMRTKTTSDDLRRSSMTTFVPVAGPHSGIRETMKVDPAAFGEPLHFVGKRDHGNPSLPCVRLDAPVRIEQVRNAQLRLH